jgi:hypothetical protein
MTKGFAPQHSHHCHLSHYKRQHTPRLDTDLEIRYLRYRQWDLAVLAGSHEQQAVARHQNRPIRPSNECLPKTQTLHGKPSEAPTYTDRSGKTTRDANPKTVSEQLPCGLPFTYSATPKISGLVIHDFSSCDLHVKPDRLDVTASYETTDLEPKCIRECRLTPSTHKRQRAEPQRAVTGQICTPFITTQRDAADTPAALPSRVRYAGLRTAKQATAFISHGTRVEASKKRK